MTAMLKLTNVCKTFNPGTINEKIALNHVDLELEENDFDGLRDLLDEGRRIKEEVDGI